MSETTTDAGLDAALTVAEEFVYRAELSPPLAVGTGPFGTRLFFGFAGGRVTGRRINADVLADSGGDWVLIGLDGFGRIDVRGLWRTDDDATIYVQYTGLVEMNEAVGTALQTGGTISHTDQYLSITLRFETGDERYAWLQRRVFVGRGRLVNGAIEFGVFRID
ncbi:MULTISPECIES: DUF3237 domain-containing protein [Protofrankia]|uniref:DUF3237 domain-containing protein n=1 Tax=Protofrankia TaxID=2994361 RepID=UPI00069A1EA1|nr:MULTISPECIES: DUF3237 domain-containing protein [Protofrankia]